MVGDMAIAVSGRHPLLAVLIEPHDDAPAAPAGATAGTDLVGTEPHRLRAQLTALGCTTTGPVTLDALPGLLEGDQAHPAVVLDGRVVAHDHALRMLVRDDRDDMTVLPDSVSGTPVGLRLSSRVTGRLTALPTGVRLDQLALSIGRHGELTSRELSIGTLVAAVPTDADAALAITAAISATEAAGGENRVRLEQSVKRFDNPVATHLISPWSRYLARWLVGNRVTPNVVTVASLVVALLASVVAALGSRSAFSIASVAILVSFALDCTDGQMARYAVHFSSIGAWLDIFGDRVKEQMFLAGIAIGGVHAALSSGAQPAGASTAWWLAAAVGGITLARNMVGFGYSHAFGQPAPVAVTTKPTRRQRLTFDLRKFGMMTYGERTLLLCVLLVALGAQIAMVVAAALGLAAALAMVAGRIKRTARRPHPIPGVGEAAALSRLGDIGAVATTARRWLRAAAFVSVPGSLVFAFGPVLVLIAMLVAETIRDGDVWLCAVLLVAAAVWWAVLGAPLLVAPSGWMAWAVPAMTILVELASVSAMTFAVRPDVGDPGRLGAATFVLLAVVGLHRYDNAYASAIAHGSLSHWNRVAIGHEGRVLAAAVLGAFGLVLTPVVPEVGLWVLTALVTIAAVGSAVTQVAEARGLHRARA